MASITSLGVGSGLDLAGLLDDLRDAERSKLDPIVAQHEQQEAKVSAYGQLQSALTPFHDSVTKLNDPALYQSLSTSVRGEGLSASAGKQAQPGSYSVEVSQLARAGTLGTQRVAEADSAIVDADATLELSFAGKPTVEVTIAAGSSLEDIRDAINATEDSGVSASIVNDGSGYRLALNTRETGEEASIVSTNFVDILNAETQNAIAADNLDNPGSNVEVAQLGQDAQLKVNGIDIVSASNKVEGAIQGVTLNLEAEGSSTLKVEQDTFKVREAVNDFVKAYNALKGTTGELTGYDAETGRAGELNGDRTVRTVESRLRSDLASGVDEGELTALSQIGISLQRDGTLKVDEAVLDEQLGGNMAALGEFFAGSGKEAGMAGRLDATLGQMLDDNGIIKRSVEGAENRMKSLDERYARMEASVERTIERYRVQFTELDLMIAQMNQTSEFLTQQFDAMDAQLGRKK